MAPSHPPCPLGTEVIAIGEAVRRVGAAFSVSRATLYALGLHRELRRAACWPGGVRPPGRGAFVPVHVVDAVVARGFIGG